MEKIEFTGKFDFINSVLSLNEKQLLFFIENINKYLSEEENKNSISCSTF